MCTHEPRCPSAAAKDHTAARVVARQDAQGWSVLCNKVVVFDDLGELLPDGTPVASPLRPVGPGVPRLSVPAA